MTTFETFVIYMWKVYLPPVLLTESSGSGDATQPIGDETSLTNNSIAIPGSALNISGEQVGIFFSYYTTPILFPLAVANDTNTSDIVDSAVIGATVVAGERQDLLNLRDPVVIKLQSTRIQQKLVSCALLESKLTACCSKSNSHLSHPP